jgi:hypothetical protein
MFNKFGLVRLPVGILAMMALLSFGAANAATLTLDFDNSFGNPDDPGTAPPDGTNWLTAVFVDVAPGEVELTLTVGAIGIADISQIYFNLDPTMDPADLTFTRNSGTGPTDADTTITIDSDNSVGPNLQADGDGVYDIMFNFALAPPSARFNEFETLRYTITDVSDLLITNSFNHLSAPSLDPLSTKGPFVAAAKVLDTGSSTVFCQEPGGEIGVPGEDGECSDWISTSPVPVPAAAWLFGSALGLLGWMRRRSA